MSTVSGVFYRRNMGMHMAPQTVRHLGVFVTCSLWSPPAPVDAVPACWGFVWQGCMGIWFATGGGGGGLVHTVGSRLSNKARNFGNRVQAYVSTRTQQRNVHRGSMVEPDPRATLSITTTSKPVAMGSFFMVLAGCALGGPRHHTHCNTTHGTMSATLQPVLGPRASKHP